MFRLPRVTVPRSMDLGGAALLQPGDILLLRGKSHSRMANVAGQFLARGRISPFTHVAIAFSNYSIADANPKIGVQVRPWSEAHKHYSLNQSVLFRNSSLLATGREAVSERIRYYFSQPYDLRSLVNKNRIRQDGRGIVCSQFVAKIFEELGFPVSNKPAYATLPIDLASNLQANQKWMAYKMPAAENPTDFEKHLRVVGERMDGHFSTMTLASLVLSKFNQSIIVISKALQKHREDGLISQNDFDRYLSLEEASSSTAFVFEAWKTEFLSDAKTNFPNFLHEDSPRFVSNKEMLVDFLESSERFASELLPGIEETISAKLRDFAQLHELVAKNQYAPQSVAIFAQAASLVRNHVQEVVQHIDRIYPPTDEGLELRQAEYESLINHMIAIQHPHGETALKALHCLYVIDMQHQYWKIQRHNYIRWFEGIEDFVKTASAPQYNN